MISKFIKEQKRYTRENLSDLLEASDENLIRIIKRLKEYGVLKAVKNASKQLEMSDLLDEDIEIVDDEDKGKKHLYVFTFVGVIIIEGRVLKCYPKYIFKTNEPRKELKQITKVLQKYDSKEQIIKLFSDGKNSTFNRLAAMVYLLNDYYEYGLYSNDIQVIETNGTGEIMWDRTVDNTFPILQNDRPYYLELKTRRRTSNDFDFFRRLHEVLLTECSKELIESDLIDILDLSEVTLTEDRLEDLGDDDYLIYRLQNEIAIQFNTRKQNLLKVFEAFLSHRGTLVDIDGLSIYGTNSFNLVWEKVCASVLNNKLDTTLNDLEQEFGFEIKGIYAQRKDNTLKELIEKPRWTEYNEGEVNATAEANDTLIPDLISIRKYEGQLEFDIFDAKYYVAKLLPNMVLGQPGIDSVIKQYMYQLAYVNFLQVHGITKVKNCFLMPTEEGSTQSQVDVKLDMLNGLNLEKIQVRKIPAVKVYSLYLNSGHIDINDLNLQ